VGKRKKEQIKHSYQTATAEKLLLKIKLIIDQNDTSKNVYVAYSKWLDNVNAY
jgi:hypothetical protein